MGSVSRMSAQDKFMNRFKSLFESHFQYLIGKIPQKLSDVKVNYYVQGTVSLDNGEFFPVHFRWSSLEEDNEKKEDENFVSMSEYYNEFILNRPISNISLGSSADRDDEIYLLCQFDNDACMEIPMGFDPEAYVLSAYAQALISENDWEEFLHDRKNDV